MKTASIILATCLALSSLQGATLLRPWNGVISIKQGNNYSNITLFVDSKSHKPYAYIGLDAQKRHMSFEPGFGDNLLYHNFPQGNIYVGARFYPNWAVELGYESTTTSSRIATLTTGEIAAGMLVPRVISPVIFMSKITVQDTHLSLVGFYPLFSYRGVPVELFGSVGVAFTKATAERRTVGIAGYPRDVTRTLVARKPVARLAIGVESSLSERLSLRASMGWVNTSRVTLLANDHIFGIYLPTMKPKNTLFFGVGLSFKFC